MDARGSTVTEVTIQDGRFTAVGPRGGQRLSPCTREINLRGRTVVPGLIDNHNHIVLLGIRPGYHTPLESATSIADVQADDQGAREERARRRSSSPRWAAGTRRSSPRSGCRRWPSSTPRRPTIPVLVFQGFTGPAATNTRGKAFFTERKVVGQRHRRDRAPTRRRWRRSTRCARCRRFDDRKRGTLDAMAYSVSVGVTTNADMGAFNLPGTPDLQGSFEADTLASADQFAHVRRVRRAASRGQDDRRALRVFFLTMDTRPDVPMLAERLRNDVQRLRRRHDADLGHRRVRHQLAAVRPEAARPTTPPRCQRIAKAGLGVPAAQPVAGRERADRQHVRNREQDDADRGPALVACARRHRSTPPTINRLKAMGAGDRGASVPVPRRRRAAVRRCARSSTAASRSAPDPTRRRSRRSIRGT